MAKNANTKPATSEKKEKKQKPGLGKGLGALLPSIEFSDDGFKFKDEQVTEELKGSIALIEIDRVAYNPYQPRKTFDEHALDDLRKSIEEHGVIQPITVRKSAEGYELIAGERRLRASKKAGKRKIPAYIIDVQSDVEMLELAIIENVQRENLNPIEVANGYQRLIEECKLTQEEVATKVGKDRTSVTNFLRLLKLHEKIQESLRVKDISMGHARALLGVTDKETMLKAWELVKKEALNVRQTEKLVKDINAGKIVFGEQLTKPKPVNKDKKHLTEEEVIIIESTENKLRQAFGTNVAIKTKSKESGKVEFEYYSKDDLERLLEIFLQTDNFID
jgi:ParB family transcriptional regulator, chromosome partitioning protein